MTVVVAIDGPAASGKSTTAGLVAARVGYLHLDTGAMYRAATLACLRRGTPPRPSAELESLMGRLTVELKATAGSLHTFLDGEDVTEAIRSQEVSESTSAYSALTQVRRRLVGLQRQVGSLHDLVCEGRDIGTVVFPKAQFKFFLVADLEVRAQRRYDELRSQGQQPSRESIIEALRARDEDDSTREHSPLRRAEDAVTVDTSNLTIADQVDLIAGYVLAGRGEGNGAQNNQEEKAQHE